MNRNAWKLFQAGNDWVRMAVVVDLSQTKTANLFPISHLSRLFATFATHEDAPSPHNCCPSRHISSFHASSSPTNLHSYRK